MKIYANILGKWTVLKGNDTIDGMNCNITTPELFSSPKFVEIIHNNDKYYINSIFIQYLPESSTNKVEFSDKRII